VAFQSGSGASLAILQRLSDHFVANRLKASFTIGGITEIHVDMLHRGAVELILHGQCFQPTDAVFDSLLSDPGHQEVTTSIYANLACKGTLTPLLDFAILSCAEIDRDFNVNTVTGYDGRFVGGIGGGPNVGRAKLTIMFTTLAGFSKRRGEAYPSIRDRVNTVTWCVRSPRARRPRAVPRATRSRSRLCTAPRTGTPPRRCRGSRTSASSRRG
jgi:citrate lyase subunit alpha/citrate CoA-transferase